jgi:hypothetical protein
MECDGGVIDSVRGRDSYGGRMEEYKISVKNLGVGINCCIFVPA